MDNGATAQKPLAVVERLRNFYLYENSNIHRGSYPLSSHASNMYEKARECIRDWIDAEYADEIVFTKGSTEAINLAACALFEAWVRPGDNVIVTELEHSSNFFPWKHWCERSGADFRVAEADKDGSLDAQAVLSLIGCSDSDVQCDRIPSKSGYHDQGSPPAGGTCPGRCITGNRTPDCISKSNGM